MFLLKKSLNLDVAGKPIYTWDSRNHRIKNTYDALQRPLEMILTKDSTDYVVEKTVYGPRSR